MNLPPDAEPSRDQAKPAGSSDLQHECLAYLLGELSPVQEERFQARLSEPSVAEMLQRQSEMIACIAATAELASTHDQQTQHATASPIRPVRSSLRLAKLIAALAATVLGAFLYHSSKSDSRHHHDESHRLQLQIAQAWVEQSQDWESSSLLETDALASGPEVIPLKESDPDRSQDDQPDEADDSLDWLVVAVQASLEDGESNDG